jgi:glycosyltransferase involved in cell wall biosynthesis
MLVGVCDFPSSYAFPPYGYGGIERWLWAAAVGARRAGADVHLLGPAWRPELADEWTMLPVRLESLDASSTTTAHLRGSRYDLLIVGHEYPSLPAWRQVADRLGCDVITFQHDPNFTHRPDTFDGITTRLYCYSDEMICRYRSHDPVRALSVQFGLGETEPPAGPGRGLVWVGRIDAHKAPHLAIMAAAQLGRRIRIVGPVFDPNYVRAHASLFAAEHVELVGELGGAAKIAAFADASTCVYTCARPYVEAGVATLGESLRAGTPVAALAWRAGTCADAALCTDTGALATANPADTDEQAAAALADAISRTDNLRAATVQEIGLQRFDPAAHFRTLAARP